MAYRQEAARTNSRAAYSQVATLHNNLVKSSSIRGQPDFVLARHYGREPIPVDSLLISKRDREALPHGRRVLRLHLSGGSQYPLHHPEASLRLLQLGEGGEDPARY